jgi:ferredoxin like protein
MKITEKLPLDTFKNDKESHILLDQKICHPCKERFCVYACPVNLYALTEKGEMTIEFAGYLECGTCMIACVYDSVKWKYPKSGFLPGDPESCSNIAVILRKKLGILR